MPALFEPLKVGTMELKHRIVLAPLTRFRSEDDGTPIVELMRQYYCDRALVPGTLLIAEATDATFNAGGYANVPGIFSESQISHWKQITDAVHEKKSYMFLQVWALGRTNPGQKVPKVGSSSPIKEGDFPQPEELTLEEIEEYEDGFVQACKNAIAAGFDGVEIHGAHGYLIDQFIQDVSNKRTDKYGGSVENRTRFALNILDKAAEAIGEEKLAIRLSPFNEIQGMGMKDPYPTFSYLISQLESKHPDLAYLHVVEPRVSGYLDREIKEGETSEVYKKLWSGPWVAAGGFTPATAIEFAEKNSKSLVAFGRHFISNPDLVAKVMEGLPLTPYDRNTFYINKSPEGYINIPYAEELKGKYY
ncbi:uncharacterized protein V2V93DRAFT_376619 [Kockiozyma suomiensis]|uniref:uncharacterized protein n=1 Tax=Kockiozyma suomiensis TaxID=1337062 RepID=UPI0033442435